MIRFPRIVFTSMIVNSHKLHTEGQHGKVIKHTIFNHMSVIITCSGQTEVWKKGEQNSPCGKMRGRNLFSCSSSVLLSVCLTLFIHPNFFSFSKHNCSQLAWSQGEHDHGNHTGDQSQWRISGKEEVFYIFYTEEKNRLIFAYFLHEAGLPSICSLYL